LHRAAAALSFSACSQIRKHVRDGFSLKVTMPSCKENFDIL